MIEEKELLQRSTKAEYHRQWDRQEDIFHYNQIQLRSKIRIKDGRAKAIDLLVQYTIGDHDNSTVEMHEPSSYLNGLTIRDLEDLLADIRIYTQLEEQQKSTKRSHQYDEQYWRDVTIIADDELSKLKKQSSQFYSDETIHNRNEGINSTVVQDINETFKTKTIQQLEQLEQKIR